MRQERDGEESIAVNLAERAERPKDERGAALLPASGRRLGDRCLLTCPRGASSRRRLQKEKKGTVCNKKGQEAFWPRGCLFVLILQRSLERSANDGEGSSARGRITVQRQLFLCF